MTNATPAVSLSLAGARALLVAAAAVASALAVVFVSGGGATWPLLMLIAFGAGAAAVWVRNLKTLMLQGAVVAMTADVSKALVAEGGTYGPGLSLYLSDLFILAYAGAWFVERAVSRRRFRGSPLLLLGIAYTGFLWFSAFQSDYLLSGVLKAVVHTKYLLLFAIIVDDVRTVEQLRSVLHAFALALGLNVAMAGLQLLSGSGLALQGAKVSTLSSELGFDGGGGAYRPSGLMQHPNMLAAFLVFALPPMLALLLAGRPVAGRRFVPILLLLAAGLAALVATLSRGGWISFALSGLFVLGIMVRAGKVSAFRAGIALAAAAVLAGAAAIAYPAAVQRIVSSDSFSSKARWIMMDQALLVIAAHPLLGVGLGGYNRDARDHIPESFANVGEEFQEELRKGVVHNKYLLVAAEHGIPGLLLFVYVLWRALRVFFEVRRWRDPGHMALGAGLAAALIGQAVFYLLDHFYVDVRTELFWVCAALLIVLADLQRTRMIPVAAAARRA